jgi:hypothetical protein
VRRGGSQRERELAAEASSSVTRLQGQGGGLVADVGLVYEVGSNATGSRLGGQGDEGDLVRDSDDHEVVAVRMPGLDDVRVLGCELKGRVNGLRDLQSRGEISADRDVEAVRGLLGRVVLTLGERHLPCAPSWVAGLPGGADTSNVRG